MAELIAEHVALKKVLGALAPAWVPHDVRDDVVDFVRRWAEKTEISVGRIISWLGIRATKFYDWRQRYGRVNEHNGWIPRDFLRSSSSIGSIPWKGILSCLRQNRLAGRPIKGSTCRWT